MKCVRSSVVQLFLTSVWLVACLQVLLDNHNAHASATPSEQAVQEETLAVAGPEMAREETAVPNTFADPGSASVARAARESKSAETRRRLEELPAITIDSRLVNLPELLHDQLPYGCVIDIKSLEEEGIDVDQVMCRWNLTSATIGTMLEMVLDHAELTYLINDGILVIVSKRAAEDHAQVVVYDASALFDSMVVSERNRAEELLLQLVNHRPLGQPAGDLDALRITIERYLEKLGPRAEERRFGQIADLLQSLVDPHSWEDNGGWATLSSVGSRLIVRQTERTHRKIQKLLDELSTTAD